MIQVTHYTHTFGKFKFSLFILQNRRQLEKYAINGVQNAELRFRVQYYVTSVTKLEFEVTRLVSD